MTSDIQINPCESCRKHKKGRVNVMSCCYETCRDWVGLGQNIEGSDCYKSCKKCLDKFIIEDGKTECTYYTGIPAVFEQVPAFLPDLYKETNDINKSVEICKLRCKKTPYPNTCMEKCEIDADAIIINPPPTTTLQKQKQQSISSSNNTTDSMQIVVICILVLILIYMINQSHQSHL
jgi:hypothetical protein